MPRVTFVKKARKANKDAGIEKGDSYYWWKFRVGRSSIKRISLTRPRQSQLTLSEFLSGMYACQEAIEDAASACSDAEGMQALADALNDAKSSVEELRSDCEEKAGNLENVFPNGCPSLETLTARIEQCEAIADCLDTAASEAESKAQDQDEPDAKDDEKIDWADEAQSIIDDISWEFE